MYGRCLGERMEGCRSAVRRLQREPRLVEVFHLDSVVGLIRRYCSWEGVRRESWTPFPDRSFKWFMKQIQETFAAVLWMFFMDLSGSTQDLEMVYLWCWWVEESSTSHRIHISSSYVFTPQYIVILLLRGVILTISVFAKHASVALERLFVSPLLLPEVSPFSSPWTFRVQLKGLESRRPKSVRQMFPVSKTQTGTGTM